MFTICVDENNYYAEGTTQNTVDVEEIPFVENAMFLPAYRYDEETNSLVEDNSKLSELKSKYSDLQEQQEQSYDSTVEIKNLKEEIATLQETIAKMSAIVYS